jgi:hypothetical protein
LLTELKKYIKKFGKSEKEIEKLEEMIKARKKFE